MGVHVLGCMCVNHFYACAVFVHMYVVCGVHVLSVPLQASHLRSIVSELYVCL